MPVVGEQQLFEWLNGFLLAFLRISAMLFVAPMFGAVYVPVQVRVLLALAFSLAVFPLLYPLGLTVSLFSAHGILIAVQQILLGLAIGFVFQLLFETVVIGMQTVSMSMGLGFAVFVDNQSGIQVPTLGQLYTLLAMLIFLALDGHLAMINLLFLSFDSVPAGSRGLAAADLGNLVAWGSQMFAGALRIALPAATALLIANIVIGVISRAAPQLNLFAIGLPFTMLVGFLVLMASVPAMRDAFVSLMQLAFDQAANTISER